MSRPVLIATLLVAGCHASSAPPESRILSYKQYASIKHGVPYVLEFRIGRGALLIYGGRHVFDPADPQIADIEREWARFHPDVAYNEGGNPPTANPKAAAIQRFAEAGLVRFLAARDQVPVATFEPDAREEIWGLKKRYTDRQVKVFWVLRSYLTFRKSKHDQSADEFVNAALNDGLWSDIGTENSLHDVKELQVACDGLFTGLTDWRDVPEDWFDPTQSGQFTNEMQNDSGRIRDEHIFRVLTTRAKRGDRVFAVIGASHAPVLEPAMVAELGKPSRKRDGD